MSLSQVVQGCTDFHSFLLCLFGQAMGIYCENSQDITTDEIKRFFIQNDGVATTRSAIHDLTATIGPMSENRRHSVGRYKK